MKVGLVACASQKLRRPAPARELYTSQLFRKSVAYVEPRVDRWFILSALHGTVHPDTVLEPYNLKLGTKQAPPIREWAERAAWGLAYQLGDVDEPIEWLVLAGEQYRVMLRCLEGAKEWEDDCPFHIPMRGLGIGEQLGWLTRRLQEAA